VITILRNTSEKKETRNELKDRQVRLAVMGDLFVSIDVGTWLARSGGMHRSWISFPARLFHFLEASFGDLDRRDKSVFAEGC
jgi:hypothetical protein